jgi:hypothetical protein
MSRRRRAEERFPLDRPPDGMVVEPPITMDEETANMDPSDLSRNNAMAGASDDMLPPVTDAQGNPLPLDDFSAPEDAMVDPTPTKVRRATVSVPAKGVHFNFEPFQRIAQLHASGQTQEAVALRDSLDPQSRYVYDNIKNMKKVPASEAARLADEFRQNQDRIAMEAQDPANRAELATKKAEAAVKQAEMQQSYLQELQYQRHIATLNNPKATRAERATAINAIDGLAASIGQRMVKGTSTAAVADAKRLVGTVSSRVPLVPLNLREYNPIDLGAKVFGYDGIADYSAQLETMLSGSQERMGVLRQQMETAGIPLPEAKQMEEAVKNPPPADKFQLSVQRFGVKGADGAQLMLNGAPVVRRKDGALFKAMPNGKGVELTAEEISQLGL